MAFELICLALFSQSRKITHDTPRCPCLSVQCFDLHLCHHVCTDSPVNSIADNCCLFPPFLLQSITPSLPIRVCRLCKGAPSINRRWVLVQSTERKDQVNLSLSTARVHRCSTAGVIGLCGSCQTLADLTLLYDFGANTGKKNKIQP